MYQTGCPILLSRLALIVRSGKVTRRSHRCTSPLVPLRLKGIVLPNLPDSSTLDRPPALISDNEHPLRRYDSGLERIKKHYA